MGDREEKVRALKTLAYCVRAYAPWFETIERHRLAPLETLHLRFYIDSLAAKFERLADVAEEGTVTHSQVEAVIAELHDAGFYPDRLAINSVAHAFAPESK
jgi:hypothetical protein